MGCIIHNLICSLVWAALFPLLVYTIERSYKKKYWAETQSWDKCSKQCDEGIQYKSLVCVGEDFFGSVFRINTNACDQETVPKNRTSRNCNYGYCRYQYVWRVVQEGQCSQTCGKSGFKMRELGCFYLRIGYVNSESLPTDMYYCARHLRPEIRVPCNRFDCPAEFKDVSWGPCSKANNNDECAPGVQRRPVVCIIKRRDGSVKEVNRRACLMAQMQIPRSKRTKFPFWRNCFDHVNTDECLKKNRLLAKIHHDGTSLVQMRATNKIVANIGQTVYAIPRTNIVIQCPVDYFLKKNLIWSHNNVNYTYVPRPKLRPKLKLKPQIRVTKFGELKIMKVKAEDEGAWYCIAGEIKAFTSIRLRSLSDGLKDFATRNTFWNKDMLNEEGETDSEPKEIIQWIASPWSACTVTCGSDGVQTRKVTCEKVSVRFYNILDPIVCEDKLLPKPPGKRKCSLGILCPKWQLRINNQNFCTDSCSNINKGTIQASLNCSSDDGLNLNHDRCDPKTKPNIECNNSNCQLKWNVSDWSKCSTTCGKKGFQARHLSCVWSSDLTNAGYLCNKENLPKPELVRECRPPSCSRSRCIDLKSYCLQMKQLCTYSVYRLQCCRTCSIEQA